MRVGSRADAEDIIQDVFLMFFRSSEGLGSVRNVKHYLIRSISNACKDFHRRKQDNLPSGYLLQKLYKMLQIPRKIGYLEHFSYESAAGAGRTLNRADNHFSFLC